MQAHNCGAPDPPPAHRPSPSSPGGFLGRTAGLSSPEEAGSLAAGRSLPQMAVPGACSHRPWLEAWVFREQVLWVCPAGREVGPCVPGSATSLVASLGTGGFPGTTHQWTHPQPGVGSIGVGSPRTELIQARCGGKMWREMKALSELVALSPQLCD